MGKSKTTQRTDTVNTVDKSRSIPGANLSNISNRIEKHTEIDIVNDNKDILIYIYIVMIK